MSVFIGSARQHLVDSALRDVHASTPIVRRIVVASLESRVGTTTAAQLVARTLARHRTGHVLYTGQAGADAIYEALPEPTAEQESVLPTPLVGALRRWDGAWRARTAIDDRWFDTSVLDVGHIPDASYALEMLTGAGAICLVSSPARPMGEAAIAVAKALTEHPDGAGSVVAFVNASRSRSTWPRLVSEQSRYASTVIPYDEALAIGQPHRIGENTRLAALQLAGDLMTVQRVGVPA